MRIALTAITWQGLHDVVVDGDDATTVDGLASAMSRSLLPERGRRSTVVPLAPGRRRGRRPYSRRRTNEPGRHPDADARPRLWLNGHLLDPAQRATNVLRDGDVVAFDPAEATPAVRDEPEGHIEIRVVGGETAGSVHRLGFGTADIGGRDDCALVVPGLPPRAATVTVKPDQIVVETHTGDAANVRSEARAITLDGEPVGEVAEWPEDAVLRAGPAAFTFHQVRASDAHIDQMADGGLAFSRPPATLGKRSFRRVS